MGPNIIGEIITALNSGKKGGFGYEGRDEWEGIPAKWGLRKSVHHQSSQNALPSSSGVGAVEELKWLPERKACLVYEGHAQEIITLANMGRPSGDGICCSVLSCIYACIEIFSAEEHATQRHESTRTLDEDEVSSVITRQPKISTHAAGQIPSSENKILRV